MPDLNRDRQALDWLVSNPNDPLAPDVMKKLGVDSNDVNAWDFSVKNPDDPLTTKVRNKVFDKVAVANPAVQKQGVSGFERFAIKNLISENTDLQQNYLRKKGYETRVVGDSVEVRRPGDQRFSVIDPEGFDVWDVTDIAGDAFEAIATGFATGAKALGVVGAAPTGGTALLAGSALGGLATGGFETARQGLGIATGLRDQMDPGRVAQATAIGATVPGVIKAGGALFKGAGEGVRKLARVSPKADAEAIKKAAEEIGAKATPGQLIDSALAEKLESSLYQSRGKIGGLGLRSQIDKNIEAAQKTAEHIVKDAGRKTSFEVGQEVEQKLVSELANKLKPAEAIYQKYEAQFARKAYKPDLSSVKNTIDDMKVDFKLNDDALKLISKFEEKLPMLQNLEDVKQFRTLVRDSFNPLDKANSRITTKLGHKLTDVRSDTLKKLAERADNPEFFQVAKQEIEQADKIYRGAIGEIESAILRPGQKVKFSPKKQIDDFLKKTPEIDRINKILKTNDPKKIEAVKKAFPEAFESLRQGKIQDIASRSEISGAVDPKRLANIIDKMPPESARLIFGDDAVVKANALKTYLDAVPGRLGPSGTPEGIEFLGIFNLMKQSTSVGRSAWLSSLKKLSEGKDVLTSTGNILTKEVRGLNVPGALGVFGATTLMPPQRENRGLGLQLPRE